MKNEGSQSQVENVRRTDRERWRSERGRMMIERNGGVAKREDEKGRRGGR